MPHSENIRSVWILNRRNPKCSINTYLRVVEDGMFEFLLKMNNMLYVPCIANKVVGKFRFIVSVDYAQVKAMVGTYIGSACLLCKRRSLYWMQSCEWNYYIGVFGIWMYLASTLSSSFLCLNCFLLFLVYSFRTWTKEFHAGQPNTIMLMDLVYLEVMLMKCFNEIT